jgi:hypothetical protein
VSSQGILCAYQSGAEIVDLPLSVKQAVAQVQRKAHAVSHRSSEDLRVHPRNHEGILLPPRIECVDGVLQVTVLGAVPACLCLPSSVCYCLNTSRMRGGTSMLADHLLPIEDLNSVRELCAPWPGDTLDHVLRGPGDT